jgi:hypothetical protein
MAEIKIEKKKPIWPWILLAVLILAAILYFVFVNNDDDDMDDDVMTEQVMEDDGIGDQDDDLNAAAVAQYNTALNKYIAFIGDTGNMGIEHEYSKGALTLLIDAVQAKADVLDIDVTADLAMARESANDILEDTYEVDHANLIKKSGAVITSALTTLQRARFPNLTNELTAVEQNLAAIKKNDQTLNQKSDVNTFFKAAETLLIKMN